MLINFSPSLPKATTATVLFDLLLQNGFCHCRLQLQNGPPSFALHDPQNFRSKG